MNGNEPIIGEIIEDEAQRDLHVGLANGKASRNVTHIGIVDPFLEEVVMPGDKFWLFLYPKTVTGI